MNITVKEIHKLSASVNLSRDAIAFMAKVNAMKMSFVKDMGLTEEAADEIVNEVLEETKAKYEELGIKR